MNTKLWLVLTLVPLLASVTVSTEAKEVKLAHKGKARCVIVVRPGWADGVKVPKELPAQAKGIVQKRRKIFVESVKTWRTTLAR